MMLVFMILAAVGAVADAKAKVTIPPAFKGDPAQYFGVDIYPPEAIRKGEQGRVVTELSIGSDGAVTACVVISTPVTQPQ